MKLFVVVVIFLHSIPKANLFWRDELRGRLIEHFKIFNLWLDTGQYNLHAFFLKNFGDICL